MSFTVVDPGVLSLVQDLGREGTSEIGVGRSGALDRAALRLANRTVGNLPHAAALEILLGGAEFIAEQRLTVAVTGAIGDVRANGVFLASGIAVDLPAGSILKFGRATSGARYYLAVAGGFDFPLFEGSAAWDGLAKVGTPPIQAGDRLPVGERLAGQANSWLPNPLASVNVDQPLVDITHGPRADWFDQLSWHRLVTEEWVVSPDSSRTALRLQGPALSRIEPRELPSEAVFPGAIQVPPDGQPIVFLADHPVTGGYPVIGVVRDSSLDRLGQVLPGQRVRLNG